MIKVLLLGPSFVFKGGVTNYLEHLIKNLREEQIQVKYFAHGKSPNKWKNIIIPLIIMIQLIRLKKILGTYEPTVVHINPSLALGAIIRDFLFLTVLKANGNHVLLFIHGWQEIISNRFGKHGFWGNYFKNRFNKADGIVVLADQFKESLVSLGVDEEKIYVSSTMVDSDKYYEKDKKMVRPYKILFCANLKMEKGPYEVLEAVPIVLNYYDDSKFVFIGEGKDLDRLKKMAKKKGLIKNVDFTGYISLEEKIMRFKEGHIFAFPTYHGEGFPTVILEAMAAGMPVVTTPVAGLKKVIQNDEEGYIIKSMPPEPKEIAEKIIKLIENPKLMKKISQNNIKRAKGEFDAKVVSRQIFDIYHKIQR
jgi:glycosyltransferase involved in cell wall biosynthesis